MYRVGKAVLEARGYTQVTPYDFERRDAELPSSYLYEELFRRPFQSDENGPIGFDAWGWGYAGISFLFNTPLSPGWAFMNQVRIDEYFRCIREDRFPVMRGFRYTQTDLRLHLLFQELQGLAVDRAAYRRFFGLDVVEEHAAVWGRAWGSRVGHRLRRPREGTWGRGVLPTADSERARARPTAPDAQEAAGNQRHRGRADAGLGGAVHTRRPDQGVRPRIQASGARHWALRGHPNRTRPSPRRRRRGSVAPTR